MMQKQTNSQQTKIQQILLTLGKAYLERRQYNEAYEKFRQLLELGEESPENLLLAAFSAIGSLNVTEEAQQIYEKAFKLNPDSKALKIGLATLFMQNKITTPFAIQICQEALACAPENETRLRLFLKQYYESIGEEDRAHLEEQKAILKSRDKAKVRAYLENLWKQKKFEEAESAIDSVRNENGNESILSIELALTHAYRLIDQNNKAGDEEILNVILNGLSQISMNRSLADLRDYLTLRYCIPPQENSEIKISPQVQEFEFILGNVSLVDYFNNLKFKNQNDVQRLFKRFDLTEEILLNLPDLMNGKDGEEIKLEAWQAILFLQLHLPDQENLKTKMIELVSNYLRSVDKTVVRFAGTGLLSLTTNIKSLLSTTVEIMQKIEEYNSAVNESDRVSLAAALETVGDPTDEDTWLRHIVNGSHLLKISEDHLQKQNSSTFLVHAPADNVESVKEMEIGLLPVHSSSLVPDLNCDCYEVIWNDPTKKAETNIQTIAQFEIRNKLLQHQNYSTYHCFDSQLGRPVILKLMSPQASVAYLQNEEKKQILYESLRNLGRMSHPHIATLYDIGEQDRMFYLVREYVEGEPINKINFSSEIELLFCIQKIVRALLYAYKQGVLHLNLKPENIWVSDGQQLKITDFNCEGFRDDLVGKEFLFPNQWRYLAPEILMGQAADVRSDIYSFGIILYEILAGHHPYDTGGSINRPKDVFNVHITPLERLKDPPPPFWNQLVMKSLKNDPEARFQNFSEIEVELRKYQIELMHTTATVNS